MADIVIYDVVPRAGVIDLGKQVEGLVTRVVLPNIRRGAGAVQLVHQRSDDQEPYPVPVTEDGDNVYWIVTRSDTAFPGRGQAELQWLGENGAVAKSVTYQTNTTRSMAEPGPVPDEPLRPYTQAVARDAQAAKNAAASATEAAQRAEASAGQAGQSAQSAQAAALTAAQNASAAETAEDGAKQAQTGAEAAKTEAQTAKTSSEKAAKEAKTAQTGAMEAKTGAEAAQGRAEEAAQGVAADREQIGANTVELEAAKQELTATKEQLAETKTALTITQKDLAKAQRAIKFQAELNQGQTWDFETDSTAAYQRTVPSGAHAGAVLEIGGMSQRDAENDVLVDAPVGEVRVSNAAGDSTNAYPISQAIRDMCPDYGIGVSADCYNYIDFATKQYHHRVGQVDLGTLKWSYTTSSDASKKRVVAAFAASSATPTGKAVNILCAAYDTTSVNQSWFLTAVGIAGDEAYLYIYDPAYSDGGTETLSAFAAHIAGVPLYYELATPEIIDLSAVWPEDFDLTFATESGGSITMHYPAADDGYTLDVPAKIQYITKLSEATADG